jgi:hypothetical protein
MSLNFTKIVAVIAGGLGALQYFRSRPAAPKAVDRLTGVPEYVATGTALPIVYGTVRTPTFVAQQSARAVAPTPVVAE